MKYVILFLFACVNVRVAAEVVKIKVFSPGPMVTVNGEPLYTSDLECRMGGMAERLHDLKREKIAAGLWTPEVESEWTRMYIEGFRDALRKVVRERLILQFCVREKLAVDESKLQTRETTSLEQLRKDQITGFKKAEVRRRVYESLMLETFRERFANTSKNEDDWFREALKTSKVIQIYGADTRPLPDVFFFPDDPVKP
jgi:hypothetical protein